MRVKIFSDLYYDSTEIKFEHDYIPINDNIPNYCLLMLSILISYIHLSMEIFRKKKLKDVKMTDILRTLGEVLL